MPTAKYHLLDGKVNATLQALYDVIAADINKMSNEGLSTKYGVLCNDGTRFYFFKTITTLLQPLPLNHYAPLMATLGVPLLRGVCKRGPQVPGASFQPSAQAWC